MQVVDAETVSRSKASSCWRIPRLLAGACGRPSSRC